MNELTESKAESIIKETILAEIISSSEAANMPEKFIANIKLKKIGKFEWEIENAWKGGEDDKAPLSVFFEYGTDRHWIQPKNPDGVLAFPSGGKFSGQSKAIYSKNASSPPVGDTIYSKGHYVSGLPALEPMTNGFKDGISKMKSRLEKYG